MNSSCVPMAVGNSVGIPVVFIIRTSTLEVLNPCRIPCGIRSPITVSAVAIILLGVFVVFLIPRGELGEVRTQAVVRARVFVVALKSS